MKTLVTKSGIRVIRILAGRSNVFLVVSGKTNIIIDTGISHSWKKLQRNLLRMNITDVSYLVLTHTHFDHTQNAARLKEKYGLKVMVHETEAGYLASGNDNVPGGTTMISGFLVKKFARIFSKTFRYNTCEPDIIIDHFYDLTPAGIKGYVLHTPGHTDGSVSIIIDDEIAVVGDTMFGVFPGSVFPPFADDVPAMIRSWGELLKTNCRLFLPSHGSADSRELVVRDYNRRIRKMTSVI